MDCARLIYLKFSLGVPELNEDVWRWIFVIQGVSGRRGARGRGHRQGAVPSGC